MALGGGTFVTQNKIIPGAYFKFISKASTSAVNAERGVATMALELNWGADGEVITVTASEFLKDSMRIFGYDYSADAMKNIRELFCHANKLHLYKLTNGGVKASNTYATAICCGTRGNDLKVVVQKNIDDETKYDVALYMGTAKVFEQTVAKAADLGANDFVTWASDATLTVTAGTALTGGTNGTVDATAHQAFLDKMETYTDTNAIGYMGADETIKALYVAFAKRMRDEIGVRLQAVVHGHAGDSVACVNVKNSADIVPWVTGVVAGTAINASATNLVYDGEHKFDARYTQAELEAAIKAGEFVLHAVNDKVRVLEDINSLVTTTDELGDVFKDNQTIRVVDYIATSVANIFADKYIGKVGNNDSGRASLWADIVKIHQVAADMGAIEGFDASTIVVAQGDTKKSVKVTGEIEVINTMERLYMETVVS